MNREVATVEIERSPAQVFEWVADHRNVPRVLEGVQRWEPEAPGAPGLGTHYRVKVGFFGIGYGTRLEITGWKPPRSIAFRTLDGVRLQGSWRFTARRRGKATGVALEIRYEAPNAVFGFLAGRVVNVMRGRIRRALDQMKDRIEAESA